MATYSYTYQPEDFLNGEFALSALSRAIRNSEDISAGLKTITRNDNGSCEIIFKQELSSGEEDELDAIVSVHDGEPLGGTAKTVEVTNTSIGVSLTSEKKTDDNRIRVAVEKSNMSRKTLYSHDWSDPCTWYEQSVRVANEVATDSGDQTRYTLAHTYVIDNYHGRLSEEDYLTDSDGYSYRVIVKVNDVQKTEQDPHYGTGGDYTISYEDGYIDFLAALNAEDEVKVTYHYQNGSRFTIKPLAGKCLDLSLAEIQFSTDIQLNDTIVFATYGLADVFAPGYYPPGTMIPLVNPIKYKTLKDFYNDAVRAYPKMSALGGSNWRSANFEAVVLDWDYVSAVRLHGTYGMEIRVELEHNEPVQGTFATATFYCVSVTSSDCGH